MDPRQQQMLMMQMQQQQQNPNNGMVEFQQPASPKEFEKIYRKAKKQIPGITVVSPMYGDRTVTDRMVHSVIYQFISKRNPFKIHLVLVDDYLEKRGENDESYYEYYTSEEFAKGYDTDKIKITIIKNPEHKYQGESREIGFLAGDYDYFLLLDCDDMLAPNACDRYLNMLRRNQMNAGQPGFKKIACIYGYLYGFDTDGFEQKVVGESIWVQSRCYSRTFCKKHEIHFPTGTNSRQGEDYPFIRKFDYALNHDEEYAALKTEYNEGKDCQCTAYWFPNENSLSRKDPHYGQHLAGWTMNSSNAILDFFDEYNKKHGFEDQEDEFMKHEYLNMNVYAFYNLLDFLKEVASTKWEPLEEDWYAIRDAVDKLRQRLVDKYYDEIVYSDIEDMLFNVHHHSDVRFTESWIGTFYDYMKERSPIFDMSYDEMRKYCKTLKFDGAGHEIHASYVKAWEERHADIIAEAKAKQAEFEAQRKAEREARRKLGKKSSKKRKEDKTTEGEETMTIVK